MRVSTKAYVKQLKQQDRKRLQSDRRKETVDRIAKRLEDCRIASFIREDKNGVDCGKSWNAVAASTDWDWFSRELVYRRALPAFTAIRNDLARQHVPLETLREEVARRVSEEANKDKRGRHEQMAAVFEKALTANPGTKAKRKMVADLTLLLGHKPLEYEAFLWYFVYVRLTYLDQAAGRQPLNVEARTCESDSDEAGKACVVTEEQSAMAEKRKVVIGTEKIDSYTSTQIKTFDQARPYLVKLENFAKVFTELSGDDQARLRNALGSPVIVIGRKDDYYYVGDILDVGARDFKLTYLKGAPGRKPVKRDFRRSLRQLKFAR